MSVCPTCLLRLQRRQAYDDQLLLQRIAFERHLHRQRELARMHALRIQAERLNLMTHIQGARLRLAIQAAGANEGLLRRIIRLIFQGIQGVFRFVERRLR